MKLASAGLETHVYCQLTERPGPRPTHQRLKGKKQEVTVTHCFLFIDYQDLSPHRVFTFNCSQ